MPLPASRSDLKSTYQLVAVSSVSTIEPSISVFYYDSHHFDSYKKS